MHTKAQQCHHLRVSKTSQGCAWVGARSWQLCCVPGGLQGGEMSDVPTCVTSLEGHGHSCWSTEEPWQSFFLNEQGTAGPHGIAAVPLPSLVPVLLCSGEWGLLTPFCHIAAQKIYLLALRDKSDLEENIELSIFYLWDAFLHMHKLIKCFLTLCFPECFVQ